MSCFQYNKHLPISFLIIKISKEIRGRKKRISSLHGKAEDGDISQRLTACLEGTRLCVQSQHSRKKKGKGCRSASTILKNEVRVLTLPNF
jgi:hypothetical protein